MKLLKHPLAPLAALALVAAPAVVVSVASPATAETPVSVSDVTVTSRSGVVWSALDVSANWATTAPRNGDAFTITLGDGLRWPAGVGFALTEKNTGETVGSCAAQADGADLVCTLSANAEKWDTLQGSIVAHGQITNALIGKTSSTLTVNGKTYVVVPGDQDGDGVCDVDCGGVTPLVPAAQTGKYGWFKEKRADGTNVFRWAINVTGSTSYIVTDPGTTVEGVSCTDGSWGEAYSPAPAAVITADTASFTTARPSTVCRVTVTSTSTADTATNAATVNGTIYEATAVAAAQGRGWAVGAPGAVETPTPEPTPSSVMPTPEPTPSSVTPTAPAVVPSTSPSASATPATTPTPSAAPVPTGAHPGSGTGSGNSSAGSASGILARTGADLSLGLSAVAAVGAGAAALAVSRRRA